MRRLVRAAASRGDETGLAERGTAARSEDASLVSVVVVNWNRAELLNECLKSLIRQSWPSFEILVVDNGSSDASQSVVRSFLSQNVRLLAQPANLGFAAGANQGIRVARGRFVALLNNDAVAEPDWLQRLVEAMEPAPDVGMCACKIRLAASPLIDKAGHLIYLDGQNRGRGSGEPDRGQYDRVEEALFPDGCAALYRKSLLDELGGFDADFFAYGDDADLGLRARWRGWGCLYVPQAVVHHRHSSTLGPYSMRKVYWVERNRLWVAIKNFPLPLLLLGPLFTLNRWAWNLAAALSGRGAAGAFRRGASWSGLFSTFGRAMLDSARQWPAMWKKRKAIRARRRLSDWEFCRLLLRYRISARRLAFQDPENG